MEFWRGMNKSQVEAKCREIINPKPMDTPFESEFLSDLLDEKLDFCIENGLRPTAFMKGSDNPYGSSYYFKAKFPGKGWMPSSWRECMQPDTPFKMAARAFRLVAKPYISRKLQNNPLCEICDAPAEECDHVEPEFSEIRDAAYQLFPEWHWKEITENRIRGLPFRLDLSHPSAYYVDYMHRSGEAKLRSVCKRHHIESARQRRNVQQDAAD